LQLICCFLSLSSWLFCHFLSFLLWLVCNFLSFAACYQAMQLICHILVLHFPSFHMTCLLLPLSAVPNWLMQLICYCFLFSSSSPSPLPHAQCNHLHFPLPTSYPPAMWTHLPQVSAKKKNDCECLYVFMALHPWLIFPQAKSNTKESFNFSIGTDSTKTGLNTGWNNIEKSSILHSKSLGRLSMILVYSCCDQATWTKLFTLFLHT